MKLLAGPLCNFSAKIRLALAEKGVSAEVDEVPYSLAGGYAPKHPLVLAINPSGSVPVLLLETAAIYDSTVILEYLEDRFPAPALYPASAAGRAACRQLEAEADEVVWPIVRALQTASVKGDASGAAAARHELDLIYARLERQLVRREYCCDEFSVADIAMWVFVHASCAVHGGPQAAFAGVLGWYARVSARPAFVQLIAQRRAARQRLEAAARVEAALSRDVSGSP